LLDEWKTVIDFLKGLGEVVDIFDGFEEGTTGFDHGNDASYNAENHCGRHFEVYNDLDLASMTERESFNIITIRRATIFTGESERNTPFQFLARPAEGWMHGVLTRSTLDRLSPICGD
jgi:hypothetical protein